MTQCPLSVTICNIPITFLRIKVLLRSALPTSSRVSDAAYGGESSVGPIPSGVPSGFAQTAPFAGTGGPIAQPAQGFHGSEPLTHGSEGDDNTGLQVLESPDDPLLTGEQPQNRETDSQAKSEGESKTN